jgi:hypothetical protein
MTICASSWQALALFDRACDGDYAEVIKGRKRSD